VPIQAIVGNEELVALFGCKLVAIATPLWMVNPRQEVVLELGDKIL
jgi:hypothetical protein